MTAIEPTCDLCGKPTPDQAYVCTTCTADATQQLRAVILVADEVETTVARMARTATRGGGRPATVDDDGRSNGGGLRATPLPYDPGARARAETAVSTIVTWARAVAEDFGGAPMYPEAAIGPLCGSQGACKHESCARIWARTVDHPAARAARYLLGQLDRLRSRPEGAEAIPALSAAGRALVSVVDAPPPMQYAGPCYGDDGQCDEVLYVRLGAATVRCPACGGRYDVAERRRWLLAEADQVLAHASLIAAALSRLGTQVTASSIRNLAARDRIRAQGQDERGRPLYRVGEVRAVVADIAFRRAERAAA